jgi:hypothetical protein
MFAIETLQLAVRFLAGDSPLLPNLVSLEWHSECDLYNSTFFMHSRVRFLSVHFPDLPDSVLNHHYLDYALSHMPFLEHVTVSLSVDSDMDVWSYFNYNKQLPIKYVFNRPL